MEPTPVAVTFLRSDLLTSARWRTERRLVKLARRYGYRVRLRMSAPGDGWRPMLEHQVRRLDAECVFIPLLDHLPDYADIVPLVDVVTLQPLETYSRVIPAAERISDWYFRNGLRA